MRFVRALLRFVVRSGLTIAIGAALAGHAVANDWYVDINAPAGGDGSQAHPFQSIRAALNNSNDGDRILVSPGTYPELLTAQKSISILGQPGATTTISALPTKGTPLTIAAGKNVLLQDLTFIGTSGSDGGGINNAGTTVAVRCHITGCTGRGGGGVYNTGTLVMWGCLVDWCQTTRWPGGGIWNKGTLKLFSSTVSNNLAEADWAVNGPAQGGGIYSSSAPVSPDVSVLRLVNVTINWNIAWADDLRGGGLDAYGGGVLSLGKTSIDHSTLANNESHGFQFMENAGGGYMGAEADVSHSIFANNEAADGPDVYGVCNSLGYLLIRDTTDTTLQGDMTGVQTGVDPILLPLADNGGLVLTQALDPASPCIDAGNPDPLASPAYDARGYPRALWDPAVGPSDLGAYEYGAAISFLLTATPDLPLAANATVALTTGGGIDAHLFALTLVDVNGAPMFTPLVVSTFDQSGVYLLEATVPPGLSGSTAGFRNYSLDANGRLETSNEALLTFQ